MVSPEVGEEAVVLSDSTNCRSQKSSYKRDESHQQRRVLAR